VNDHKNMILAIVLSAIVLFGWGFITETWFPAANEPTTKIEQGKQVPIPQPRVDPAADTPQALRDRRVVLGESPRVQIATPSLSGSINLRGARIDDLVLSRERETMDPNSPPVRLFSPAGTPGAYFAGFGWAGQGVSTPGADTVWQSSGTRLTPSTPVTLSWNNGQGQIFQIVLKVDENYLFNAEQRVINRGTGAIAVRPYALASRVGPSNDPDSWTSHVGPMGVFNDAADYDNDFSDIAEEGEHRFTSTGGWVGFTDKYWLAAVIPDRTSRVDAAIRFNRATNSYQTE
jgi:YidC/Oxa1 family membrane protein insertase